MLKGELQNKVWLLIASATFNSPAQSTTLGFIIKHLKRFYVKEYQPNVIQKICTRLVEQGKVHRFKLNKGNQWRYASYKTVQEIRTDAINEFCDIYFDGQWSFLERALNRRRKCTL